MDEVRILSPLGMLGYGFPLESFQEGLRRLPHAICADAGSTDAGPHKLGAGVGIVSRQAAKKDLAQMLEAGDSNHIPVLVGSSGGSGAKAHVDWTLEIVEEIIREHGWVKRVGVIYSDIDKAWLHQRLDDGEVSPLGPVPQLTHEEIDKSIRIVAQMGHESYVALLEQGVDVIIGGRSYDPVMTAVVCIHSGFDKGLAYHMGKILECGAQCAIPGSAKDCMLGTLRENHFILEPLNEQRVCTTFSVAAHTLYEKSHTYHLPGPGGMLDLSGCEFFQADNRRVRVTGSRFVENERYQIKLEGSKPVGYRTLFIAGIRDPLAIERIDEMIEFTRAEVQHYFSEMPRESYSIDCKIYGKNGVMGELEPQKQVTSHELGLVYDVVAPDQSSADAICAFARSTMLHYHYTGRYATAGNLAFPFSPSDISFGQVYRFNIYHLVTIDSPQALFPGKIIAMGQEE